MEEQNMVLTASVVELSEKELFEIEGGGWLKDAVNFAGSYMLYGAALLAAPEVAVPVAILSVVGSGALTVTTGLDVAKDIFHH
jgi:bacteriocin-like protein